MGTIFTSLFPEAPKKAQLLVMIDGVGEIS